VLYNTKDSMKTFVIQLEEHDDLTSARDKLKGAKAQRVVFVWPKSGKGLSDHYSLSWLKREAERLGLVISFISSNHEVRENARLLGIPLFPSLSQAERVRWKNPRSAHIDRRAPLGYQTLVEERERLHPAIKTGRIHELGQAALFLIGILSLAAMILFFLPSAEVRITPQKTSQNVVINVKVDPNASGVNPAGVIPGRVVSMELSGSETAASSGRTRVAAASATGVLQVANQSGTFIDLPLGTVFSADSNPKLTFQTLEHVLLPPDKSKMTLVNVIASQPGSTANLNSGESFSLQTTLSENVSATNPNPFSGGDSMDAPTPSKEDLEKVRQALMQELKQQAGTQLLAGKLEGTQLIESSLVGTITSETHSAEPGQPADHFTLGIKANVTGMTYFQADLNELAQSILDANLPPSMSAVPNSLQLAPASESSAQDGAYAWRMSLTRQLEKQISTDELVQRLVGMPIDKARERVDSTLVLEKGSEISISPAWWKSMPFVAFRIRILEQ
jgi:hypothetical protein